MGLFGWETVSRDDPSYKACLTATTGGGAIVGGMTGSFLGPAGTIAGYAGGAAWGFGLGYLACPYVPPLVKKKIESGFSLSDSEIRSAADAMSRYAGVQQASDAVKLVALVKSNARAKLGGEVCRDPARTARQLLASA